MSLQVNIEKGHYRGEEVSGVFEVIKTYTEGARGGVITIKNPNPKTGHPPAQRISVEKGNFTMLNKDGEEFDQNAIVELDMKTGAVSAEIDYEAEFISSETEEEAMERIADTFAMLDRITEASAAGIVRGLVISGPPGVGKSFGVMKTLEKANMLCAIADVPSKYEVVSGGVSSIGLYQKLYHNRAADRVLVFDDSDGILFEEECLNLLKAALNSGDTRRICWNKESRVLKTEDIPESFEFEASIIFLSNIDFDRSIARGSRVSNHLAAIMSRCHYLDLEIGTMRDRLLRIKQIVRDGMLEPFQFTEQEEKDILTFVFDNAEFLREVSLRMVKKIADIVKASPGDWRKMAESTTLTREAKFKRLLEARNKQADTSVTELQAA